MYSTPSRIIQHRRHTQAVAVRFNKTYMHDGTTVGMVQ